jgi:hypothetical protein
MFGNFAKIGRAAGASLLLAYGKIGYFSVNIIFSRQSPVLPDFQPKFGTFVRIFI